MNRKLPVTIVKAVATVLFAVIVGAAVFMGTAEPSHAASNLRITDYDIDMTVGTALVMGTESTGLTGQWRQAADAHIRIPMLGRLDSLNVSVSAAILLFEAVRQRQHG